MIKFEWNTSKAISNKKKHGVSFEEAKSVFHDECAVQFYDSDSSQLDDDRFLILGISSENRTLMICHCERELGEVIRIISARKATKKEKTFYTGNIS